jgi:hypothetical protein
LNALFKKNKHENNFALLFFFFFSDSFFLFAFSIKSISQNSPEEKTFNLAAVLLTFLSAHLTLPLVGLLSISIFVAIFETPPSSTEQNLVESKCQKLLRPHGGCSYPFHPSFSPHVSFLFPFSFFLFFFSFFRIVENTQYRSCSMAQTTTGTLKWIHLPLLICVGLVILPSASAAETPSVLSSMENELTCDLNCWLQHLVINIPDQSTVQDGFNLSVSNMVCKNFSLSTIDSKFLPPTMLSVNPQGIGGFCYADWGFREVDWPHISGSGEVSVEVDDSSASAIINLKQGQDGFVNKSLILECDLDINIAYIDFGDGIIDEILSLFKSYIEEIVQTSINNQGCTGITQLVDTNLTLAIQDINDQIRRYLLPLPPVVLPPVPPGTMNLKTDPLILFLEYMVKEIFNTDGILSFCQLVDRFTNETGSIFLNQNDLDKLGVPNITATIVNAGNITFGITGLNVTGLNSCGPVALFTIDNYTLGFHSGKKNEKKTSFSRFSRFFSMNN